MTGRDLIIYILENNFEDATILNVEEAALKRTVGPATIEALIKMDKIKGIKIGDNYLVFIEERNE